MRITTREEIINGLVVAAGLEHGLMAQYLYAEMTLKDASDGLTSAQLAMVQNWRRSISGVARQEMGHLATVLNLLEAVGGGAYLDRLRFPSATGLYTPPIPFSLDPLRQTTIQRFIDFEMPVRPAAFTTGLAPVPIVVQHVGQLYSDLNNAITTFDEAALFIGRGTGQDTSAWSLSITVSPVRDRATAVAAVDSIIHEGEGDSTGSDTSHYGRFKQIQRDYQAAINADATFQPHRNVISNPATLDPPDPAHPDTTPITDANTHAVAELFSACYTTLLLTLVKYYRFEENADNQNSLQGVAKTLMMLVIAKLGPLLSKLPAGNGKKAGPPFEIYTLPSLPNDRDASLKVLRERFAIAKDFAAALAPTVPLDGIVARVSQNLDTISQNIPA
jgi:hypothetical protein